jgi:hypothetical protein
VPRGSEALRQTSGGCLAWLESVRRSEGGKAGGARLGSWALIQPCDHAVDIEGGGDRDVRPGGLRSAPIPGPSQAKGAAPLGERAFDTRAARVLPLALCTRLPGLGGLQGLGLRPRVAFVGAGLRRLRGRTARALRPRPAGLRAETHVAKGRGRGADALRPAHRCFALRTVPLRLLPGDDQWVETGGALDLGLPAHGRSGGPTQRDALVRAAFDQPRGADRGRIDQGILRRPVLGDQRLLDGLGALRLMDAGRGRGDVREEGGRWARTFR